jgi:hypothetical protein
LRSICRSSLWRIRSNDNPKEYQGDEEYRERSGFLVFLDFLAFQELLWPLETP